MPEYVLILAAPARQFYEQIATRTERRTLDEILARIAVEPAIDDVTKFAFRSPTLDGFLFADVQFWIIYAVTQEGVSIINIGFEEEIPSVERAEDYP